MKKMYIILTLALLVLLGLSQVNAQTVLEYSTEQFSYSNFHGEIEADSLLPEEIVKYAGTQCTNETTKVTYGIDKITEIEITYNNQDHPNDMIRHAPSKIVVNESGGHYYDGDGLEMFHRPPVYSDSVSSISPGESLIPLYDDFVDPNSERYSGYSAQEGYSLVLHEKGFYFENSAGDIIESVDTSKNTAVMVLDDFVTVWTWFDRIGDNEEFIYPSLDLVRKTNTTQKVGLVDVYTVTLYKGTTISIEDSDTQSLIIKSSKEEDLGLELVTNVIRNEVKIRTGHCKGNTYAIISSTGSIVSKFKSNRSDASNLPAGQYYLKVVGFGECDNSVSGSSVASFVKL